MGARFNDVSTAFKEVEGGYLFKLNPWLFGHSHVYLVDEAKRDEIISQMERNRRAIDRAKQRAKAFLIFGAMGSLFFKSWVWASGWPLDRFYNFHRPRPGPVPWVHDFRAHLHGAEAPLVVSESVAHR